MAKPVRVGGRYLTSVSRSAVARARHLRSNMTAGETRLWSELRLFRKYYGLVVRRQAPIGPYVVDFVIHSKRLVIELDGEFHFTTSGKARDRVRDAWFAHRGYRVQRIPTGELIENFDGCINSILHELGLMK